MTGVSDAEFLTGRRLLALTLHLGNDDGRVREDEPDFLTNDSTLRAHDEWKSKHLLELLCDRRPPALASFPARRNPVDNPASGSRSKPASSP